MIALRRARPDERKILEDFQHAAYSRTEAAVGARAIPLEWDYGEILEECEVWFGESARELRGVLILRIMPDMLFLESIATAPQASGSGYGRLLLEATFERARALGVARVGLITNSLNPALAWYKRMGFATDREDVKPGRVVVHMSSAVPEPGRGPGRE